MTWQVWVAQVGVPFATAHGTPQAPQLVLVASDSQLLLSESQLL
jgi:hypothetical protein